MVHPACLKTARRYPYGSEAIIKAKIARLCKAKDAPWLAQYPVKIKRSVARVLEVALKARGCDAFPMGDFQRRQG